MTQSGVWSQSPQVEAEARDALRVDESKLKGAEEDALGRQQRGL